MQPALLGGVFIGILSALPIVQWCNCCCLWIIGGGALAAYLQQQNQGTALTVGGGAQTGLFAGVIGAFVWLIVTRALDVVLRPLQQQLVGEILRNASDMPPEVRAMFESIGAQDGGMQYTLSFLLMLVIGSAAAALGGAVAASYFRKDVPPALGGPIPPPPLP
jgi:hypothetical protein